MRTVAVLPLALALLAPQARPQDVVRARAKISSSLWLGAKDAPLTIVEYTDYQCGYCRRFHVATFPEIRKKYIDTGKVRFLSRDLPLEMHSNAFRAAEAARCAGDQGKFWELRDVMVANSAKLAPADIQGYAESLRLKMAPFRACLSGGKHQDAIRADMQEAAALNIYGTPAFLVGKTTPEGVDGYIIPGAVPLEVFDAILTHLSK